MYGFINAAKDSSGSSEEETSAAMAQSGKFSHKLEESDDDFNSNLFCADTTTLSVLHNETIEKMVLCFHIIAILNVVLF